MTRAIFMAIGAGAMGFYAYLNPGQLHSVIDQVSDLINYQLIEKRLAQHL